jgi:hypothetical protein
MSRFRCEKSWRPNPLPSWLVILPLCVWGCTGQIAGEDTEDTSEEDDVTAPGGRGGSTPKPLDPNDVPVRPDDVPKEECNTLDAGTARLQRITRDQYNRTVSDVFGETGQPATKFSPDERPGIFHANQDAAITDAVYQHYVEAAEGVADRAVARLDTLVPCNASQRGDEICAREILNKLGRRLYRRPLITEQADRLLAVYRAARMGPPVADHKTGLRDALAAALQSPHFLYLEETATPVVATGAAAGVSRLDGFSIAARLATYLWSSAPDDILLDAAASGALATSAGITSQAERMLADPRAKAATTSFFAQWLQLERLDRSIVDNALRASVARELTSFVGKLYERPGHTLSDLFVSRAATLDAATAAVYGASATASELDGTRRAGVLTRAGFLASSRGVPARGKFVLSHVLCREIELPSDVDTTLAPRGASENPRQHFDRHRADPQCAGCHRLLDPIGHTFWHYDESGRWVDSVDGWTVDARGALTGSGDADGDVNGVVELSQRLAGSRTAGACFAEQWLAFALRRDAEATRDRCSLALLASRQAGSPSLHDILLAVPVTDAFTHLRRPEK